MLLYQGRAYPDVPSHAQLLTVRGSIEAGAFPVSGAYGYADGVSPLGGTSFLISREAVRDQLSGDTRARVVAVGAGVRSVGFYSGRKTVGAALVGGQPLRSVLSLDTVAGAATKYLRSVTLATNAGQIPRAAGALDSPLECYRGATKAFCLNAGGLVIADLAVPPVADAAEILFWNSAAAQDFQVWATARTQLGPIHGNLEAEAVSVQLAADGSSVVAVSVPQAGYGYRGVPQALDQGQAVQAVPVDPASRFWVLKDQDAIGVRFVQSGTMHLEAADAEAEAVAVLAVWK